MLSWAHVIFWHIQHFTEEIQSHPERGCVGAQHLSELLHQMILCCLLPEVKFQCLRRVKGEHKDKVPGVLETFMALYPSLHIHSSCVRWLIHLYLQLHTEMLKNLLLVVLWYPNFTSFKPGMPNFPLTSEAAALR